MYVRYDIALVNPYSYVYIGGMARALKLNDRIEIRIGSELIARLDRAAAGADATRSDAIRWAIDAWVSTAEANDPDLKRTKAQRAPSQRHTAPSPGNGHMPT